MKSKFKWSILVLGLLVMLISCAAPAVETPKLVGCKVDLSGVYIVRRGADHVVTTPIMTVTNPNPYDVAVDNIVYKLDTGQGMIIYEQLPGKYYIPAGQKIDLQGVGYLSWGELVAEMAGTGIPMADALAKALPVWKGAGGNKPAVVAAEVWGPVQASAISYAWEISLHTAAQGMEKQEIFRGKK